MKRRDFVTAGAAAGALAALAAGARADSFPSRPIKLIVPFGAGGPTDLQYRKLAELAGTYLGQPVIVENKPGAGTTLGPSSMAKTSRPDGYTISGALAPLLRYPHMQKVDWDPLTDFTYIIGLGGYNFVAAVRADSPYSTMKDLIDDAKRNPGKVTVGTPGAGTTLHLLTETLNALADTRLTHVGFRSGSENLTNLLGGHVAASFDAIGSFLPQVEAGKVKILMTFGEKRMSRFPAVPTATELGYELAYPSPYGIVGPKDMPSHVVDVLHDAFKRAMEHPENQEMLERLQQVAWYRSPAQYKEWAEKASKQERALVERAGLERK